jgi:hypothetical protein
MRRQLVSLAALLVLATAPAAQAAVPQRVVPLLGSSVGYLFSQSDLCRWDLSDRIKGSYQDAFRTMGMTRAQQAVAWEQAAATQQRMADLPAEAKERMRADTCTAASRSRVEHDLADRH